MFSHHLNVEINVISKGIASFEIDQTDPKSGESLVMYQGVMGRHQNLVTDNGRLKMGEVLDSLRPGAGRERCDDEFMLVGQGAWSQEAHESFFGASKGEEVTLGLRMEGCGLEDDHKGKVKLEGASLRDSIAAAMISPLVGKTDTGEQAWRFMFSFEVSEEPIREMALKHETFMLEFSVSLGARKQKLLFIVRREMFDGTGFLGRADAGITVH